MPNGWGVPSKSQVKHITTFTSSRMKNRELSVVNEMYPVLRDRSDSPAGSHRVSEETLGVCFTVLLSPGEEEP